jgi:hypothetical protein
MTESILSVINIASVGFIFGATVGSYAVKKTRWSIYDPETFIYTNGVIIVLYQNGKLGIARDRNQIVWSQVKEYLILR